jgi:hypothetical protein
MAFHLQSFLCGYRFETQRIVLGFFPCSQCTMRPVLLSTCQPLDYELHESSPDIPGG